MLHNNPEISGSLHFMLLVLQVDTSWFFSGLDVGWTRLDSRLLVLGSGLLHVSSFWNPG